MTTLVELKPIRGNVIRTGEECVLGSEVITPGFSHHFSVICGGRLIPDVFEVDVSLGLVRSFKSDKDGRFIIGKDGTPEIQQAVGKVMWKLLGEETPCIGGS